MRPDRPSRHIVTASRPGWWLWATLLFFQSHWVDDLGSGSRDVAGIAVSAIGTVTVGLGMAAFRWRAGRLLLGVGLAFVLAISLADIVGLQPDGSLTPDLVAHWRTGLGPILTVVVLATLALAAFGLLRLVLRPAVSRV